MQSVRPEKTPGSKKKMPAAHDSKLMRFFEDQLEDIYWAEKKLVKTLPKMAGAAHSDELRNAFESHLRQTERHVSRLERVFTLLDWEAKAKECPAIKGIAEEGEEIINETEDDTAQRDVGLIFAGQKAEHYEIATYGGLLSLARTMGQEEVAKLLEDTLREEKTADEKLSVIAETHVNDEALHEYDS